MKAVVLGAALVYFMFPGKDDEVALLAEYHTADSVTAADSVDTVE